MTVCNGTLVFVDELDSAGAGLDAAAAAGVCMMLLVEVIVLTWF